MASVSFLYRSSKDKAFLIGRLNLQFDGELEEHENTNVSIGFKTKIEASKTDWFTYHVESKKMEKELKVKFKSIPVKDYRLEKNKIDAECLQLEEFILNAYKDFKHTFNSINNLSLKESLNSRLNAWLKTLIENYYNPEKTTAIPIELVNYIDHYIAYRKNEVKLNSLKRFKVIQNKLKRFIKKRDKEVLIEEVNNDLIKEFIQYCKDESYSYKTIKKDFVQIKMFCRHAAFLGLKIHHQLERLKFSELNAEEFKPIYLDFEELKKIEKLELKGKLEKVRDWLLISCYTGQRVSDFLRFNSEMIRSEKGSMLIEFTQQKTGKIMTIPLHSKVIDILDKRNGDFPPTLSDVKYNLYLKEICLKANIDDKIEGRKTTTIEPGVIRGVVGVYKKYELISSHVGRRSFATNFYGDLPTSYLTYITGHSTEAMFLQYIGKSNKDLALEIAKVFDND